MSNLIYHIPDFTMTYYLFIPRFELAATRILVLETDAGYSLPSHTPDEHHFGVIGHLCQMVRERFDLGVAVMLCLDSQIDHANGVGTRYYALDTLDDAWQAPANSKWVTGGEARKLNFVDEDQAEHIQRYFMWLNHHDDRRVPWARHGWFRKIVPRIADIADRLGYHPLDIEQVRAWGRSATLRLITDQGDLYTKSVPSMFAYEPVITRILHLRYPQHSPNVLAVNVDEAWMVTEAFPGKLLSEYATYEAWEDTVVQFATIQQDIIPSMGSLISLGIPDRNIDQIGAQIDRLLVELPPQLSTDEKETLRRIGRTLRSMIYDLMDMKIPLSLVHGDLWSGNIVVSDDGNIIFFDWSDCSVSHPFFDLPFFLSDIERELPDVPDAHDRLRDAYLARWTRYEPMDRLKKAYEFSRILSPLHMAMMYQRFILPGMEDSARWEMENMLPHLLRQVLAGVKAYNPM